MENAEELSIVLPPDIVAEVRSAVSEGEYGSLDEVVYEALQSWRWRRAAGAIATEDLRRLAREGIESGPGLDADEVFARLRAKFRNNPGE